MQVDRGKDEAGVDLDDGQAGHEFDLAARHSGIEVQLLGRAAEILLKHLRRNDTEPRPDRGRDQVGRAGLLGRIARIVGIDKDIRVNERSYDHRFRRA